MSDQRPPVYVVDDDQDIRNSLSRGLGQRGFEVDCFASAGEFLAAYDGEQAACLILDYGMPEMNGLELQALLTRRDMPLAVIFITGHGGVPESVQAMKGGAVDFLEKPFRQSVLVERIEAAFDLARAHQSARGLRNDIHARIDRLTAREKEIVDHILAHPAEASSKDIANSLGISPRTIDHHRARILEKLQVRSVVELVDLVGKLKQSEPGRG